MLQKTSAAVRLFLAFLFHSLPGLIAMKAHVATIVSLNATDHEATTSPPLCSSSCTAGEYCSATDTCTLPVCTGRVTNGVQDLGWNFYCALPDNWAQAGCGFFGYDRLVTNGGMVQTTTACARVCETNFYATQGFRGATWDAPDNCACLFDVGDGPQSQNGDPVPADWIGTWWHLYPGSSGSGPMEESTATCGMWSTHAMAYKGGSGGGASAIGDPHLQNVRGERFDLMMEGNHVLINIPRGTRAGDALLRVLAGARRLGGQCADMYFQEINITGSWADAKQVGGYHYSVSQGVAETPQWATFGKVELKIAHGRTKGGITYLNLHAKHLGRAGFDVGGLLGVDDHGDAATPPADCFQKVFLKAGNQAPNSAASVATATFA